MRRLGAPQKGTMQYTTSEPLPLRHDPLKALIAPRPIGWISTLASDGSANLAPYSFFQILSQRPGIVVFCSEGRKDSIVHAEHSGEFVCNVVTRPLLEQMILSSAVLPQGQSEFEYAGLQTETSRCVAAPRVKGVAAALECKVIKVEELVDLHGHALNRMMVYGQVVSVYIDDRFLSDGLVDTAAMELVARCGYFDYAVIDRVFAPARSGIKPP